VDFLLVKERDKFTPVVAFEVGEVRLDAIDERVMRPSALSRRE